MTDGSNPYCDALGIGIPKLEVAKDHRDANYYGLLIVVLLERGEPVTLQQAAQRFEMAGVASAAQALASLRRCKPGRAPIYRDGDRYALDPHDEQADLWAFRLGLRPPAAVSLPADRPAAALLPTVDAPLRTTHLDEAWRGGLPSNSSAQRVALCILDAHGRAMEPEEMISFVSARSRWSPVSAKSADYWRRGSAIRVRADGRWELDPDHEALRSARQAVIDRIETLRSSALRYGDPAVIAANCDRFERERQAHAGELRRMRRVLIHAFPAREPRALVLVDVAERALDTFVGDEIGRAMEKLAAYDLIASIGVRTLLRTLRFDPGSRRLGELGPPQKTRTLNRRGRTLKITTGLLVQGSCGISRPFGDETKMREYLAAGELPKLRRRLEADAKSLYAIYQYGRLHGTVRLRWGFLDERLPAPWVHRDEAKLHDLKAEAYERRVPLQVVVGSAPGWADPWSRLRLAHVVREPGGWRSWLVDDTGSEIQEDEIQLARLGGFTSPER
ncbi:MAG: hypothetical protein OXQ31_11015 [Spirochaetaceae bacterium]|nr:hypothetical protein [Spirochaetaceae bacterium]